jgi:hypothetical protein
VEVPLKYIADQRIDRRHGRVVRHDPELVLRLRLDRRHARIA